MTAITPESEQWKGLKESFAKVYEALDISEADAIRRERQLKYNKLRLDESKKDQFFEWYDKALAMDLDKPLTIKHVFEDNGVDMPERGFTLVEMAMAIIEREGLQHKISLTTMKERIRHWLQDAHRKYGFKWTYKEVNGVSRYFLAKKSEDHDTPIENGGIFVDKIMNGIETRKGDQKGMRIKEEEAEVKEEEPEPIIIDTEGNPTVEEKGEEGNQ